MISYLIPITLLVLTTLIQAESSLKDTDSAWSLLGVSGYAGQITMNPLTGSSIFFWFFESLNTSITTDSRPLIIWLDGGPGCSGSYTMIWEAVAPIYVNTNTEPLRTNTNITWATSYHLLMIDFPYGTGFSYANSESDLRNNTFDATFYLYKFLLKLGKKYPAWFNREIFIFGESYGGHWVPGISYHIAQQNALNPSLYINLKGIGIGGAWVNPKIQTQAWASYGLSTGNINENQASILRYYQNLISIQISNNQFNQASENFNNVLDTFGGFTSGLNVYNVRTYDDDDLTNFENWITSASTRKMLNVGNTPWTFCNRTVNQYNIFIY